MYGYVEKERYKYKWLGECNSRVYIVPTLGVPLWVPLYCNEEPDFRGHAWGNLGRTHLLRPIPSLGFPKTQIPTPFTLSLGYCPPAVTAGE